MIKRFSKFGLVGVANTIFSYAVFSLLFWLSVHYLAAATISLLFGTALSYYLNAKFTFDKAHSLSAGKMFFIGNIITLIFGLGLLAIFTEYLKLSPFLGQLLVVSIRLPLNYLFSTKLVFKN